MTHSLKHHVKIDVDLWYGNVLEDTIRQKYALMVILAQLENFFCKLQGENF